jgi:hypothetical protein
MESAADVDPVTIKIPVREVKTGATCKADTGAGKSSFSAQFALQDWIRFVGVSAALLIPVYWHRRIEAGDLASHVYNAWLAQLIREGQAPGLWIARQWNNVLFDLLLSWLGSVFGLRVAERIAVSFAVLIFFWGAFALISLMTPRAPWNLSPLIVVFAYGWTFEMGFMNYYISLGLCFLALAAFLHFGNGGRLISLALIPLIWTAHPLGVICFAALAAYTAIAKALQPRHHGYLLVATGIFLLAVRTFLARRYEVKWNGWGYFFFNGADQLALYSSRYYLLYALFAALFVVVLATDASSRWREGGFWDACGIPLQLYLAIGTASLLLPTRVRLPQYAEPLSYLTPRLTSVSGILACGVLGTIKPRKWHAIGYALIASAFFTFLYIDTGILNRMEEQVERSVAALPAGHRVVGDIDPGEESRVVIEHIVDRACIGHCFSYENYEPPTGQFRVRAAPGNSIVDAAPPNGSAIHSTRDLVKALDPPIFEISQCVASAVKICVRELSADEINELIEGDSGR